MNVSIVIPTRNRAQSLARSLEALAQQQDAPEYEVIVVDNGSDDATPDVLAQPPAGLQLVALREEVPNRALARNRGIDVARGELLVFVDDDVIVPPHFVRAHALAHEVQPSRVVSGPILNVASFEDRPLPNFLNQSRAFFCTCNASVPAAAVRAVGKFDEGFSGYGWEDTELGVRLRHYGLQRTFAWQAYVYHLKPPGWESFDAAVKRMQEKGRMARRFVQKSGDWRVRLATGDHPVNHVRGAILGGDWTMPIARQLAQASSAPRIIQGLAREHYLDGVYRAALSGRKELGESRES